MVDVNKGNNIYIIAHKVEEEVNSAEKQLPAIDFMNVHTKE